MKLLQTKDYLLLIDEGAEIKENYFLLDNEYIYKGGADMANESAKKIVSYYPLSKEAKELDLPLLPKHDIEGFRVIQDKQFSLEDIQKAFEAGVAWHVNPNISELDAYTSFIQSLSTQQLPKEFVGGLSKKKCPYDFTSRCTIDRCDCEFVFETTTNSEGKEILIGTYKY